MKYTVIIHVEPIEYEVEAKTPEQAEIIARNNYSYDGDGNEKAEVFMHCDDCDNVINELKPYKLDTDTMLCEDCMDQRMEE